MKMCVLRFNRPKVTYTCWNEDSSVQDWLRSQSKSSNYLLEYFEQKLVKIVSKLNKNIIRWEESYGLCCVYNKE